MSDNVVVMLPHVPDGARIEFFRALSTPQLKRMWDDVDRYHAHCDEIHAVMNERGEGRYVAV